MSDDPDDDEEVDVNDYEFEEDIACFAVVGTAHDGSSLTFKCDFGSDSDAVTLREAMLVDLDNFSTFYIELYGHKYELECAEDCFFDTVHLEGRRLERDTKKPFICLSYVDTKPAIDLDNTSWADWHAEHDWTNFADHTYTYAKHSHRLFGEDASEDDLDGTHTYAVKLSVRGTINGENVVYITASSIEDAAQQLKQEIGDAFSSNDDVEVTSVTCDGKRLSASMVRKMSDDVLGECDGGGDAGGAAAAGDAGAAGESPAAADGDAAGIKSADVLGSCNHHIDGYLGPGCFHVPSRVPFPLHRQEAAYGGSKRKSKRKKTAYEQGMKTVVKMFEADL